MSIERYAVIETALCIGGNLHDGEVLMVRADEHDRELGALREELENSGSAGHLRARIALWTKEAFEMSERLTVAEQRNATLSENLENILDIYEGVTRSAHCGIECDDEAVAEARAALQPTESGASE